MKKALVTLAIGKKYRDLFRSQCEANWKRYADRHSFDLIVIDESPDNSERAQKRSPAWQKLLILSQDWSQEYDQIVWVDTDVLLNPNAPDITSSVPIDKIGAVDTYAIPSKEEHSIALQRKYDAWRKLGIKFLDNSTPGEYYKNRGLTQGQNLEQVVQTGVFVCSPKHHRAILEHTYNNYEDTHGAEWNYEMPALSYEILSNNLIYWLEPRFNYCVLDVLSSRHYNAFIKANTLIAKARNRILNKLGLSLIPKAEKKAVRIILNEGYFVHFANCTQLMSPSKQIQ